MTTTTATARSLHESLDALPDLVFLLDDDGVILDCRGGDPDDRIGSRESLIGKHVTDCPGNDAGPRWAAAIEAARNGGGPSSVEYTLPGTDSPKHFEARFARDTEGGFLCVVRNTTHREASGVDPLEMLKAAFDATAEGILVVDLEGHYLASNSVFHDMWRIPRHVLGPGQEQAVLEFAASMVQDAAAVKDQALAIHCSPRGRTRDLIQLTDDRFFECVSMPQRISRDCVGRVWSFRDVTDRVRAQQRTRHDAYHDSLTGLPNRALFQDRLTQEVGRARRAGSNTALLLLDLDRFKTINDTLGHVAGDRLLIEVANRLESRRREGDTIARLGGDEFVLIASHLRHKEDAAVVAEQLLEVLKDPIQIDEHNLHISASIGIAVFPDDGAGGTALMKSADLALYRAKELGRDNYQVFEQKLNQRAMERLVLENDLRRAIREREFVLHYQPQFDLKTGEMRGLEALIRWTQGKNKDQVVLPGKFIPIAEECGLIVPLGSWVLEEAARACAEFNRSGAIPLRMCVNVSALQIQRPNFANEVAEVLRAAGLPPKQLILELTESALMNNPEQGSYAMEQLRRMGVGIAMDDFGTGHSSLNYVSVLPISLLKIDKSFVENCAKREADTSILGAIVTMGHALGLKVLAEGVETKEQERVLVEKGCDEVQGYLYGRPMSEERMRTLLGIDGVSPDE